MINNPDRFETTLMEFEHGVSRSAVHVIGMLHFAAESYYAQVQTELEQRHGAGHAIHYEYVGESGEKTDWMTAKKIAILKSAKLNLNGIFSGLGLVSQLEHVRLHPDWENHDMSIETYVSHLSWPAVLGRVAGAVLVNKTIGMLPADKKAEIFEEVFERNEDKILLQRSERQIDVKGADMVRETAGISSDMLTLDARNDVALQALDRTLLLNPSQDVTMMWGEAHLVGLLAGLKKRGFYQTDQQRLTAVRYADMHEAAKYTKITSDFKSFRS